MKILILLFDNFTALDVIGPYDILNKVPGVQISFIGAEKREYKDPYGLKMYADLSLNEVTQTDILLIPGGSGIDNLLNNDELIAWIRKINLTTQWTVSVCSGSLLLARAGLLYQKNCTTHWRRKEQLRKFDVNTSNERYVQDSKFITSAGVSAGIDMSLFLVSKIAGDNVAKMIQLAIEYDPKPPFDCGSPEKAPQQMVEKLRQ